MDDDLDEDSPLRGCAVALGFALGAPPTLYAVALLLDGSWPVAFGLGAPGVCVLAATVLLLRGKVSGSGLVVALGLALVAWSLLCDGLFSGWGD